MRLYITQRGTWAGTQAEARAAAIEDGSGRGGWREREVPTDKAGLLRFLNHTQQADHQPTEQRQPDTESASGSRWRAYYRGEFFCAFYAEGESEALDIARQRITIKLDRSQ